MLMVRKITSLQISAIARYWAASSGIAVMIIGMVAIAFLNWPVAIVGISIGGAVLYTLNQQRKRNKHQWYVVQWRLGVLLGISLATFLIYFVRRGIGIEGTTQTHPVMVEAQILTVTTSLLCIGFYVAMFHPVLGTKKHKKLSWVLAQKIIVLFAPAAALIAIVLAYFPQLWLTDTDITISVILGYFYAILLEIQNQTDRHSLHALLSNHGPDTIKKHLPKQAKHSKN